MSAVWGQTEGYNYILANGGEILNKEKTEFLFGRSRPGWMRSSSSTTS